MMSDELSWIDVAAFSYLAIGFLWNWLMEDDDPPGWDGQVAGILVDLSNIFLWPAWMILIAMLHAIRRRTWWRRGR